MIKRLGLAGFKNRSVTWSMNIEKWAISGLFFVYFWYFPNKKINFPTK